jgi:hypothetical protein
MYFSTDYTYFPHVFYERLLPMALISIYCKNTLTFAKLIHVQIHYVTAFEPETNFASYLIKFSLQQKML